MKISISKGNQKMGLIRSVSLPPIISCRPDAPCTKTCYAAKAVRLYATARAAWQNNLDFYNSDPAEYFEKIAASIQKKNDSWFRFSVAGDMPNPLYFVGVKKVARACRDTRFLVFTKQVFPIGLYDNIPENLSVVKSMWPGLPAYPDYMQHLPKAWMKPKAPVEGYEIPLSALPCPGSCTTCNFCYNLRKIGADVVFDQH